MARKWETESAAGIDMRTMEGMLIEIFGCVSFDNRIITLTQGKDKGKIKSDFYLDGKTMDGMLIEIFGCVSLDKVIQLDASRDRKKAPLPFVYDEPAPLAKLA